MKSSKLTDQFFWNENFESFDNSEAIKYHEGVTKYPFNIQLYDKLLLELFEKNMPLGKLKILDAGGGTGKWTEYFAERGHEVTLLDCAEPMLGVAMKNLQVKNLLNNVEIILGSICELPFENNQFDFILCDRNPISHCGKKEQSVTAIKELYRVLKPNGVIIASVLNKLRKTTQMVMELDFEKAIKFYENGFLQRGKGEFTYYYTSSELNEVLISTGFKKVELLPTTALAEYISTAWLLNEIALEPLLELEQKVRANKDMLDNGVRYHFIASK